MSSLYGFHMRPLIDWKAFQQLVSPRCTSHQRWRSSKLYFDMVLVKGQVEVVGGCKKILCSKLMFDTKWKLWMSPSCAG